MILNQNADYLLELFDNISDVTVLENTTWLLRIDEFYLSVLLHQLNDRYRYRLKKKVKLKIDSGEADILMTSDYDRLFKMLNNLLNNALKFAKKGLISLS